MNKITQLIQENEHHIISSIKEITEEICPPNIFTAQNDKLVDILFTLSKLLQDTSNFKKEDLLKNVTAVITVLNELNLELDTGLAFQKKYRSVFIGLLNNDSYDAAFRYDTQKGILNFFDELEIEFVKEWIAQLSLNSRSHKQDYNPCFDSIMETTESSLWVVDRDYKIISLNKVFEQNFYDVFGIKPLAGLNIISTFESFDSELAGKWKNRYDRVFHGEEFICDDEFESLNNRIYIRSKFNPIKKDNLIIGAAVQGESVAEQKIKEEYLKKSEEKYRTLFETMSQGVVYHGSDGVVTSANTAALEILGLTFEQMVGRSSMDDDWHTIHDDGTPFPGEEHPAMLALKSGKKITNVLMGVHNPYTKKYRWINVSAVPQFKDGETKPFQVYATFHDVTTKKEAENALVESEEKYRTLFENMSEGFAFHKIVVDSDGTPIDYIFFDVNPAFEQLTSLKKENIVGRKITEVFPGVEDDPADWIGRYGEVALTGKARTFEDYSEGLGRWFSINAYSPKNKYFAAIFSDITETKIAEQQIKDALDFNQKIIDSSSLGIYVYDYSGQCISANDAAAKIVGAPKEKILQQNFREIEFWKKYGILPFALSALKTGKEERVDVEIVSTFGKRVWVKAIFNVFHRLNRKYLLLILEDVTKTKLAEKKLAESQEKLQMALDASQVGVWFWNLEDNSIDWDDRAREMIGVDKNIGMTYEKFETLLYPEDVVKVKKDVKRVIKEKSDFIAEYRILKENGEIRTILLQGKVLFRDENTPEKIYGVCIDITERKRNEEKLQHLLEMNRIAEEIANMGGWEMNIGNKKVKYTANALKLYGIEPGEYDGNFESVFKFIHPDDRKMVLEKTEEQIKNKNPNLFEYRIIKKDGDIRTLIGTNKMFFDDGGNLERMVGMIQDITVRKKAEEEIKKYAHTQETLLREVNHRVKNNLLALQSILHKEEEKALIQKTEKITPIIHDLITRVNSLSAVHTILSSSGWSEISCDLLCREIVSEAISSMGKSQNVLLDVRRSDVMINSTQAHHLTLVLNELATNSVKHALRELEKLHISVSASKENEEIILQYRDDGPGFPNEIFDENYSSVNIGFQLITGIVKQSLSGEIEFHNKEGAVTIIKFLNEDVK